MLLEDYGLIGDMQSAALVGRNGAVDWLCLPRFDSASCFSALLGDREHGQWVLAPAGEVRASSRRYRPGTLVLESDLETAEGAVRVIEVRADPRRQANATSVLSDRASDAALMQARQLRRGRNGSRSCERAVELGENVRSA